MNIVWPPVLLSGIVVPQPRPEAVVADKEYRLLGVRLDGQGPFLRETVMGASSSAARLFRVKAGDFIYSRLFACRGAFGIIPDALDDCHVSGEFPIFATRTDQLDVKFLNFWFQLSSTQRKVDEDCTGSTPLTRNRFKENFFLALQMPLPPLAEQQRIVARIEAVAAQVQEARRLQQESSEALKHLVAGTHHFMAGTRKRKLGDVLCLDEDSVAVTPDREYPQVGVRGFGAGLFAKSAVAGTDTTYKAFNRLYTGALVLSQVKGWEGAIAVCPQQLDGWFVSPEYRTFRCIAGESSPGYFAELVRTEWFWSQLASATRGVGARRERTRPEQFLSLEMPMPDYEQQLQAERLFGELHNLRNLKEGVATELDALLPAVLDKAFRGELV